jgi:hypothetical protein
MTLELVSESNVGSESRVHMPGVEHTRDTSILPRCHAERSDSRAGLWCCGIAR